MYSDVNEEVTARTENVVILVLETLNAALEVEDKL